MKMMPGCAYDEDVAMIMISGGYYDNDNDEWLRFFI